jgi:Bacterial sugar transferase
VPYDNTMSNAARVAAFLKFAWHASRKAIALRGEIIFATSTPLTIAIPALLASWSTRRPMVFEVRDLWPAVPLPLACCATPCSSSRRLVRPGITGWAQVNGRNAISWDAKLAYDVWYVEHQSFALDLKILMLTIKKVTRGDGVSQAGHVTSEKFRGART